MKNAHEKEKLEKEREKKASKKSQLEEVNSRTKN